MPIICRSTDETVAAVARNPGLEECLIASYLGRDMLRVRGRLNGHLVDTYVAHSWSSVSASIAAIEFREVDEHLVSAATIDAAVAAVEAYGHAEHVELTVHEYGEQPQISLVAPGIGAFAMHLDNGIDVARELRLKARVRRQDTEGHRLSALGAMTLGVAAADADALDRLVDTVYRGGTCRYGGVDVKTSHHGEISTSYMHGGVALRSDGIEIPNLPETVRTAILGKQRRRLGEVVEMPGFEDLDIVGIGRNAMEARRKGGAWVRLDVRDRDGARFAMLEIEEGREIARRMQERRRSCG